MFGYDIREKKSIRETLNDCSKTLKDYDISGNNFKYNITTSILKKCEITKEHFKGLKNDLYFLKHTNHLSKKSTNYEIPPIKVILEAPAPSKGNIISLSLFYSLVLLLIMI